MVDVVSGDKCGQLAGTGVPYSTNLSSLREQREPKDLLVVYSIHPTGQSDVIPKLKTKKNPAQTNVRGFLV